MRGSRPTIMIRGFYGANNSGDEAMLRNFVFKIKDRLPNAVILIATDRYANWRIKDVHYVSVADRAKLHEVDLLVIGGGDLGVGYGWDLLIFGKIEGIPCVKMGVSINDRWIKNNSNDAIKAMLNAFDKIYVRDVGSNENLKKLDIDKAEVTTDIAIDLPTDDLHFIKGPQHCSIVVREVRDIHYQRMMDVAYAVLERITRDYTVSIIPFSPEDTIICKEVAKTWGTKVQIIYSNNPLEHKFVISNSNYLVSIGRFHPLVYAMQSGVPMIGITYPEICGYSKINDWLKYCGMYECAMDFIAPMEHFDIKWKRLQEQCQQYKAKIKKKYNEFVEMNNKQFDEIVGLIK